MSALDEMERIFSYVGMGIQKLAVTSKDYTICAPR